MMNRAASTFAEGVDLSMLIITGISLFFLIGITIVMIYFVFRYNKKRNAKATNISHNNTLEIIWTAVPTVLVLVMFYYGWMGYKPMRNSPDHSMEITAYGQMWQFSYEYPGGKTSDTLVVPVDLPVKLNLVSRDVLHSFYVPAFRIKEDLVPGKNNFVWFEPTMEGEFQVLCAEYCGLLHSKMLSTVKVVSKKEYADWVAKNIVTEEAAGLVLMKKHACFSCHTQDGTRLVGPSFKGIYGKKEKVVTNGQVREIEIDDEYIKRSIYQPNADVVETYTQGLMISYEKLITPEEVNEIIEYLKTIK